MQFYRMTTVREMTEFFSCHGNVRDFSQNHGNIEEKSGRRKFAENFF